MCSVVGCFILCIGLRAEEDLLLHLIFFQVLDHLSHEWKGLVRVGHFTRTHDMDAQNVGWPVTVRLSNRLIPSVTCWCWYSPRTMPILPMLQMNNYSVSCCFSYCCKMWNLPAICWVGYNGHAPQRLDSVFYCHWTILHKSNQGWGRRLGCSPMAVIWVQYLPVMSSC